MRGHQFLICTHNNSASFTVVSWDILKCSLCNMHAQIFWRITGPLKEIFVFQISGVTGQTGFLASSLCQSVSIMAKSFPVLQHLVAPGYWYILQQHHAIHMQPSILNPKNHRVFKRRSRPNLKVFSFILPRPPDAGTSRKGLVRPPCDRSK